MLALLSGWTAWVVKHPKKVLTTVMLVTLGAAWIAVSEFSLNSNTERLIRQDTDWRRNHDALVKTFPQYDKNTFVVVSGASPGKVLETAKALTHDLAAHTDIFSRVNHPASNPVLDKHALLFMDIDQLDQTLLKLAEAQPMLTAVAEDGLNGVLQLMTSAVSQGEELPTGFQQMTRVLEAAINQALEPGPQPISWRDELFAADGQSLYYQIIFVQGRQDFGRDLPNRMIIERLKASIDQFAAPYPEAVQIRLSGLVPLEHSEIVSAMDSAQLAGSLALLILIAVLVWGVRSLRIILATYIAMLCGLIWTAAFAMLTVGQYNTISIIFLVMFIGLGVDFAIHLCLKYQESLEKLDKPKALIDSSEQLGPALILCGITSAMGFLSFVPTNYIGLAEMGLISGGGMIIAVVISLTVIPAFFALVAEPAAGKPLPFLHSLQSLVDRHHRSTAWVTLALLVVLAGIATQARFDYGTLSLKDPTSEAMTTLQELHDQQMVTDYALLLLVDDESAAAVLKPQLKALSEVGDVRVPEDYLPADQSEKLLMLEDTLFLMEALFYTEPAESPAADDRLQQDIRKLTQALEQHAADRHQSLIVALKALDNAPAANRQQLEQLTTEPLREEIAWLAAALSVGPLSLEQLPDVLRSSLVSDSGQQVMTITPAENVVPVEAMRRFTESVMTIAPAVVGRPVLDLGIGDIVVRAFFTALTLAMSAIFLILLITLRSLIDSLLVFIPLVMTALFTLAISVVADLPLNMANVVVIPLIFGLGVDNGIHIVKRYRQSADVSALAASSTPKAVFLSNLTTLGTFFALIFASHLGIYSIGVLLTVALICLMALTLVSLPALLATFSPQPVPDERLA